MFIMYWSRERWLDSLKHISGPGPVAAKPRINRASLLRSRPVIRFTVVAAATGDKDTSTSLVDTVHGSHHVHWLSSPLGLFEFLSSNWSIVCCDSPQSPLALVKPGDYCRASIQLIDFDRIVIEPCSSGKKKGVVKRRVSALTHCLHRLGCAADLRAPQPPWRRRSIDCQRVCFVARSRSTSASSSAEGELVKRGQTSGILPQCECGVSESVSQWARVELLSPSWAEDAGCTGAALTPSRRRRHRLLRTAHTVQPAPQQSSPTANKSDSEQANQHTSLLSTELHVSMQCISMSTPQIPYLTVYFVRISPTHTKSSGSMWAMETLLTRWVSWVHWHCSR